MLVDRKRFRGKNESENAREKRESIRKRRREIVFGDVVGDERAHFRGGAQTHREGEESEREASESGKETGAREAQEE